MRVSTILAAAAALATGAVDARIISVGLPKTIKAGETFSAEVTVLATQPRQELMIWGLSPYDYEWHNFPYPGSIGDEFARTNLYATLKGQYSDSIPDLKVPETTQPGDYGIQAVILQWSGATNTPSLQTWFWNVTVGDATSEERVWVDENGDNSRNCYFS